MLIRFTVNNFLSFKDETEFLMIPGHGTSKTRHVISPEKNNGISVLQSGIIYGANSAGKSNLLKAVDAARKIIIKPLEKELVLSDYRFKLDNKSKSGITSFEFEIIRNGKNYAYGFSYSPKKIKEEWLFQINTKRDIEIFTRRDSKISLNKKIIKNNNEFKRLSFIADDLFPNQLFLTMVNNRNVSNLKGAESFISVFSWIKDSLIILFPESQYNGIPIWGMQHDLSKAFDEILSGFDTGIKKTGFIDIQLERLYEKVPKPVIDDLKSKLPSGKNIILSSNAYDKFLLSISKNQELKAKELVTYHDDSDVFFEMSKESDGTKRLTDLLPLFLNFFEKKECVILVDELDRSLHTELSYKFMELFFKFAENNHIQFILTTHDTGLLDQKLFRKDEIWFVQKDKQGASKVYSLAQFKPRDDLKLRRGYLNGRFGAIPFFGNNLESFIDSIRE